MNDSSLPGSFVERLASHVTSRWKERRSRPGGRRGTEINPEGVRVFETTSVITMPQPWSHLDGEERLASGIGNQNLTLMYIGLP